MGIKSKLKHWNKQGLIEQETMDGILAYEKQRLGKRIQISLSLCGVFSIVLGIALLIAANWDEITGMTKIVLHFIVSGIVGAALLRASNKDKPSVLLCDGLTLVFCGLNLSFIALIGQVFQLNGELGQALTLWLILSSPAIILFARTRYMAWLWIASIIVTLFYALEHYLDGVDDYVLGIIFLGLSVLLPLAFYADHAMKLTKKYREEFSIAFRKASLVALVLAGAASGTLFYGGSEEFLKESSIGVAGHYGVLILIAACAVGYTFLIKILFAEDETVQSDVPLILICLGAFLIPLFIPVDLDILGAFWFMGFWGALAILWQRSSEEHLVSLAITLITIRLYIIFLELFGDALMSTGLGLILCGALLIGMVKVGKKLRDKIRVHYAPENKA